MTIGSADRWMPVLYEAEFRFRAASVGGVPVGSLAAPQMWFCKFQRVSSRVAEIERAGAVGPVEFSLDGDAVIGQPIAPQGDLGAGGGKADVAGAGCAMRWNRQGGVFGGDAGLVRVEDQQNALIHAKKHVAARDAGDDRQVQDRAVERLGRDKIAGVKRRFQHRARM